MPTTDNTKELKAAQSDLASLAKEVKQMKVLISRLMREVQKLNNKRANDQVTINNLTERLNRLTRLR